MEAHNKPLKNWLHDVEIGTIRLPRFQRKESWKPNLIKKFLQAVISEHPLGVLLLLEVNSSDEPFVTRKIEGSEESENCRMHLLDGQQRLTALFRALKDNYSDRIYFVRFSKQEDGTCEFEDVIDRSKKSASNLLDPAKEYDKGWIPVSILEPGETGRISANRWKNAISDSKKWDGSAEEKEELEVFLDKMRDRFNSTNIPSLIIPQGTDPSLAIEIFISINTSSVKLSHFDIANAQCEQKEAKSLHDMVFEVENRR